MPIQNRFSETNAPNKRRLRRRIAARIFSEICSTPARPIVISMTNTELEQHWQEFGQLLGPAGRIHIAEIDPAVMTRIHKVWQSLPTEIKSRFDLGPARDFYDTALLGIIRNNPDLVVLDADFCSWWSSEQERFLSEIPQILNQASCPTYLALTRCRAHEHRHKSVTDAVVQEQICQILPGIKCLMSETYQDGMPMSTMLFQYLPIKVRSKQVRLNSPKVGLMSNLDTSLPLSLLAQQIRTGEDLRELIRKMGVSQVEFARLYGSNKTNLQKRFKSNSLRGKTLKSIQAAVAEFEQARRTQENQVGTDSKDSSDSNRSLRALAQEIRTGKDLGKLIKAMGVNQKRFAKLYGCSQGTVSHKINHMGLLDESSHEKIQAAVERFGQQQVESDESPGRSNPDKLKP